MDHTDDAEQAEAPDESVLETCPGCGLQMDVSGIMPFTDVACPSCGQVLRARVNFNNFTILDKLGEGGMGTVFKAQDRTLSRYVALKVLKKEISGDEEEREKLALEARLTATINHPHVVKVYDFGQDHGQFYLAMELIERGSLDSLMSVQRRVAELQMLEVGMQIAMGLEAALAVGLIHRDIKPGNILFADPHTAKLVDFGLAIVMDEGAQSRGEIWGTPYYIAPEKLDGQPEDFRSDMYSLGGTIFHALAGRPPYEAETASMVALKQLKSQPVSLQAFAPDVTSETAYVVNRMMAKHPDERYQSYEELIGHLTYARDKLLEKVRRPVQPKQRVVMETEETRKWTALLSIGMLLVVLLVAGGLVYMNRDTLFGKHETSAVSQSVSAEDAQKQLDAVTAQIVSGDYDGARSECDRILKLPGLPQPQKSWVQMNAALADFLAGDKDAALAVLKDLNDAGLYSNEESDQVVANMFLEASRVILKGKPIPLSIRNVYGRRDEGFALLLFAVWDWEAQSDFRDGGELARAFMRSLPATGGYNAYKPIAQKYAADWALLEPVEKAIESGAPPADVHALIAKARAGLQTGSRLSDHLDVLEKRLTLPPAQ